MPHNDCNLKPDLQDKGKCNVILNTVQIKNTLYANMMSYDNLNWIFKLNKPDYDIHIQNKKNFVCKQIWYHIK